jgi:hypothetical protein
MVSDGSCGHRPMIWRPSDMVSVIDRPINELIVVCCAQKSTSQKNSAKTNQDPTSRSSLFSTAH